MSVEMASYSSDCDVLVGGNGYLRLIYGDNSSAEGNGSSIDEDLGHRDWEHRWIVVNVIQFRSIRS